MSSTDAKEYPSAAASARLAATKHIEAWCGSKRAALAKCREENPNYPEKCLDKQHQATQCLILLLTDFQQRCSDEFNSYADCLNSHGNEVEFCREEQAKFEDVCPL